MIEPMKTWKSEKSVRIVIIGAGIVGCCAALWLQRAGHSVTLVDRNDPGTGASFGNAGCIASFECAPVAAPGIAWKVPHMLMDPIGPLSIKWRYLPHLSGWLVRFLLASRQAQFDRIATSIQSLLPYVMPSYEALLGHRSSRELLHAGGALIVYDQNMNEGAARNSIAFHRDRGIDCQLLSAREVRELEPALAPIYSGGVLFPDNVYVKSPKGFVEHIFREFTAHGGHYVKADVRTVKKTASGLAVVTDNGLLQADRAILAGGAWSNEIVRSIGESIPLDTERGYHVTFDGAESLLSRPVCYMPTGFYLTPMDGALRAAGTVELGGLKASPSPERFNVLADQTKRLLPGVGSPSSQWMGFRPSMPDSKPVIGPSKTMSGLYYAFGHGHLGLSFGALTGYILMAMIDQAECPVDPLPFAATRF
ncbi:MULTISPECIES: NAD(P)/FAD-dependent oxidoreductase [Rhizobium/Agrobacterium group]|nr:FAD-binding oxidoreductase [Agrobacterium rosae]